MVGVSEGEAKFLGYQQARFLVDSWIAETGIQIFLNADHHKNFESSKEAIDYGYDSVLIDASKLSYEENLKLTKKVAEYAKSVNPEIMVEGELGYLVTESSKIYKEKIEIPAESLTKPEETAEYIKETGVHLFAPAIGNLHGIAANVPNLRFNLLKKIDETLPDKFLVLHGGSGLSDGDFRKAIENGIVVIHINTEVRKAYRQGLDEKLKEAPDEIAPYKFLDKALEEMQKVVEQKVKIFLNV